jgi:formate-dependent nitrite reductase membrane component NrfD
LIALVFLAITTGLLVLDLKRPDRFLYILVKPNLRSWLVWGAWILIAYGVVAAAWLGAALAGRPVVIGWLAAPAIVLAAAAAGYSAFLFGQAEGRDFWQSPLLLPQLLVAAVVAGAAVLVIVAFLGAVDLGVLWTLCFVMAGSLLLHGVMLVAELGGSHANLDTARAARLITHGPWRMRFWIVTVLDGTVLPILLVWWSPPAAALGAVMTLVGLWNYEDLWVKAGQAIPLS